MADRYTAEYFRTRRMGEALADPFDARARTLKGYRRGARLLGDLRGKRLLDVGCGLGAGSWLMACRGAHVTGIDLSEEAIDWARRTYQPEAARLHRRLDFWTVDLLAPDGGGLGEFDALTVVDVLEHFPPDEALGLLEHLRSILRPGGRMFLHVPITANSIDWVLLAKNGLIARRLKAEVLDHHGDVTHEVRYSVRSVQRLLGRAGWHVGWPELRAYNRRLDIIEKSVAKGRWSPTGRLQAQVVTDWDGLHTPKGE